MQLGRIKPVRLFSCLFFCFRLDRLPENVACPLNALLIGVGVHSQGNGFVAVAQLFGYTCHIGSVDDRHGCEAVAQLVGVHIWDIVPF